MFHIELRQPPHRLHRFNLTEQELLLTVLEPWARGTQFEIGERVWDPSTCSVVVLESPEIPIGSLTMGRGWAVAQRKAIDVTAQALASAKETLAGAAAAATATPLPGALSSPAAGATPAQVAPAQVAPADAAVLADALGLQLLRSLGESPMSLPAVWKAAAQQHPQLPAGAALDLARAAVASLVSAHLARLSYVSGGDGEDLPDGEREQALAAIDSWTAESGSAALWISRG